MIFVRFFPTEVQSYNGDILNSGGGAAAQNVAVSGTGIPAPASILTVSADTLEFSTVRVDTVSSERMYTIEGINLSPANDTLTIAVPTGYSISTTTGSGFSLTKKIAYADGIIPTITIYVRFAPIEERSYTGDITNTAGGITKTISVKGTGVSVTAAVITENPTGYILGQNYPNPFNPTTVISYKLKEKSDVKITVYDILGREIAVLVNEVKDAGDYTTEWNGSNSAGLQVGSGMYFYIMKTNTGFVSTKKLVLMK
ncbi:MAG: T9SS type A sorting domain-containing protein [Bacteroidetes bacterium]|nr:T9SS type A sorting domain-containing protein [Bacteroidota bacterium]